MLEQLALKLLGDEVDKYTKGLLVEGVNLSSNIANVKRLGFMNESSSDTENDSVSELAARLSVVKFDENQIIEDRQSAVYKAAILKTSLTEGVKDADRELKLRKQFMKADTAKEKQSIISELKDIQKNNKKEE